MKSTFEPSWLIVALCQNAKFGSKMLESTSGSSGSEMSRITPWPMHAPAAMSSAGYAVMSWQPDVARV